MSLAAFNGLALALMAITFCSVLSYHQRELIRLREDLDREAHRSFMLGLILGNLTGGDES